MTIDITVPALGESVTEATVMRWLKAPGDAVALDETLVELETDKIAVEVKAEAAGTLAEIAAGDGAEVEVGALLGRLEAGAAAAADAAAAPEPAPPSESEPRVTPARLNRPPPSSPAVRHLLEEHGLDPATIEGTGKGGRLLKSDVLAAVVARAAATAAPDAAAPAPDSVPSAAPEAEPRAGPRRLLPARPAPAPEPSPAPAPGHRQALAATEPARSGCR